MNSTDVFDGPFRATLRSAAKSATMRQNALTGAARMTAVRNPKSAGKESETDDDRVFDDADALIALAQKSFSKAAKAEVAKNNRLGIPTHGSAGGKLVVRKPAKALHHP
jgi:hypothetical protein